jgi:hypothetical protein
LKASERVSKMPIQTFAVCDMSVDAFTQRFNDEEAERKKNALKLQLVCLSALHCYFSCQSVLDAQATLSEIHAYEVF